MGQATNSTKHQRPPGPRLSLLGAVCAAMVLVLLVAMLAQARQYALLHQAMQAGDDQAVRAVYATHVQTLQLRELVQRHLAGPTQRVEADGGLHEQFARWQAAASDMQSGAVADLLGATPPYLEFGKLLSRITADAGPALAPTTAPTTAQYPDRERLASLLPALLALDEPLRQLSQAVNELAVLRTEQRAAAIRQHNHWGLAVTVFMAGLTAATALLVIRQLQQLRARRVSLEKQAHALEQTRRESELASESKSVFLANMSHEVRTPFHGLMGMLSLLRETGLTARQLDYLRTATESADHLLAILSDILDMSQLETGRMTVNPAPLALRGLLRDIESVMRPQTSSKSLALHIEADAALPECIVGDAARIKQIVLNLLSNAVKFTDRGEVVLDVRRNSDERGLPVLQFVVTDTGIGMDEATRKHLFQRFMRTGNAATSRRAGTGLGLEISRNLARLMQGDIEASSQPGEGSAFTFSLPLQVPDAASGSALAAADAAVRQPASQRLTVLVAEDHPVNRQYMAALLENLGHTAHFTANGQEALQAVQDRHFDLVLMDLHMPVLDGLGATRAIRALPNPEAATVPIVALTGDSLAQTQQRCLVAGMNDFLAKPVSPQKLARSLRRLFGSAVCDGQGQDKYPAAHADTAELLTTHPVIDTAALQKALQSMPHARLAGLLDAYLNLGPQTVARLRAAVRDAQPLELRVNAHAAKGEALNLGLSALAATADALHEGAAHLPAHEIARLVQRFESLLPQTREAIRAAGLQAPADTVTG